MTTLYAAEFRFGPAPPAGADCKPTRRREAWPRPTTMRSPSGPNRRPCATIASPGSAKACRSCAASFTAIPRFRAMAARRSADRRLSLPDRRRLHGLGRLLRSRQRPGPRVFLVDRSRSSPTPTSWATATSPMFAYERSVSYPEGHRNVVFAERGIRPLPRLPMTDDECAQHARSGHADALPIPEAVRRHRGLAHLRHRHGHGLARQRSAGRAGRRDLPGRPPELRDAGRAATNAPTIPSADGGRWGSFRWR